MSEPTTTPENSEPETGPVLTPPPAPVTGPAAAVAEPPRPVYIQESSRLNKAAAWVGIVAGVPIAVTDEVSRASLRQRRFRRSFARYVADDPIRSVARNRGRAV